MLGAQSWQHRLSPTPAPRKPSSPSPQPGIKSGYILAPTHASVPKGAQTMRGTSSEGQTFICMQELRLVVLIKAAS